MSNPKYRTPIPEPEIKLRKKTIASAIGSVQAEGLKVSIKVKKNLTDYAEGKMNKEELIKKTVSKYIDNHSATYTADPEWRKKRLEEEAGRKWWQFWSRNV